MNSPGQETCKKNNHDDDINITMSIGKALINEREKKDISLEYISSETNISLNTLSALEKEDVDRIPGEFYIKNYIKNYLKAINADEDTFLEAHENDIQALYDKMRELPPEHCPKLKYSRFKKKNLFFSIFMTSILFIVAFYFIYINRNDIMDNWNINSQGITLPQTGIDFEAIQANDNFNDDYCPVNVSIEFFSKCWAQIYKGKTKIAEQVFGNGAKFTTNGYEIAVTLGNPSGLRLSVNGKEVTYLRKLVTSEKIIINPITLKTIMEK